MKEKKTVIGLLLGAVMLMAIGYAAFATNLVINGTANIESNWKVLFTNITQVSKTSGASEKNTATASGTTATFDVGLTSPGDYIEYLIEVANQGSIDAVIESINATETGSDAITFEITNIKTGDILLKNATTTFNVKISYKDSVTSQPSVLNNTLTVEIKYVQNVGQNITPSVPNIQGGQAVTLMSKLRPLIDTAQSDVNLDFSKTSEEDGTTGLYYTNTNTEDNKTTYYFRGAVDNNYVKFGKMDGCAYNGQKILHIIDPTNLTIETYPNESQCTTTYVCDTGTLINDMTGFDYRYVTGVDAATCSYLGGTPLTEKATYGLTVDILWRIVRINEDGSIRLISQNSIGDSGFNTNYTDNAYVGYMHGSTGQSGDNTYKLTHSNDNPSTIKGVIDNWYSNNTNLSGLRATHLADAGFCNDRSVAPTANTWATSDTALGYGNNVTYYGAYNRLNNLKKPQFACPNASNDLFTTNTSSKGNKALDYPIGLITMDEVAYAGGVYNKKNSSYYLQNSYWYKTMSPSYFLQAQARVWSVTTDGVVESDNSVGVIQEVRPVVSLQSRVEIVSGNGEKNTPYVIKTN